MSEAVDVSWPQGNYQPGPEALVFVGASSADGGTLFVQHTYAMQVDNARRAGKQVGHYFFNGAVDPLTCADYFVAHLHDYRPGDLIALDVESSGRGKVAPWTPSQALIFRDWVAAHLGISAIGMYGSISVMSAPGWGSVEHAGAWLWLAWPGLESQIRLGEWSRWSMWQYTIAGGVDRDHVNFTDTASSVVTPTVQPKEVFEMASRPVIIANSEKPGIFHVVSVPEGWQSLDTGEHGNAELRGLTKIITAITSGALRVDLTGEEIDATRGLLSSPVEK